MKISTENQMNELRQFESGSFLRGKYTRLGALSETSKTNSPDHNFQTNSPDHNFETNFPLAIYISIAFYKAPIGLNSLSNLTNYSHLMSKSIVLFALFFRLLSCSGNKRDRLQTYSHRYKS